MEEFVLYMVNAFSWTRCVICCLTVHCETMPNILLIDQKCELLSNVKAMKKKSIAIKIEVVFWRFLGHLYFDIFFLFSLTRGNYTELLYQEIHFKEAILGYYGKFINSLTVVFSAGEQRSKTKLTLSYVWPRFEDVLKACDSIGWMNSRRRQLASPKSAVIVDRQAISSFS